MSRSRWRPPGRLKQPIRHVFGRLGYEVVRLQRDETRFLQHLMSRHSINLLLDVGANQGQYAMRMRSIGYGGEMHSFEPGSEAFRLLSRHASRDPRWTVHNLAVGAVVEQRDLYVSEDSVSSSLLEVAPAHIHAAPASVEKRTEHVEVRPLQDAVPLSADKNVWLKMDTQGSEGEVLEGMQSGLRHVRVVQTELSLLECYYGQADYRAIIECLHENDFRLAYVEPGTPEPSDGSMLQFDAIFTRDRPAADQSD